MDKSILLTVLAVISLALSTETLPQEVIIYDKFRDRHIPIETSMPENSGFCSATQKCPVALISSGYGVKHNDYSFISQILNKLGYLVVSVQHELDGDPPLSRTPPFIETRKENWQRGVVTLNFVKQQLMSTFNAYDFDKLTLVGHSNGGDISALYSKTYANEVDTLVTLDHRREPLPRNNAIQVLTIRASDFQADEGVLLTQEEQAEFGAHEVKIETARHNDMTDYGPEWLKEDIASLMRCYLSSSFLK